MSNVLVVRTATILALLAAGSAFTLSAQAPTVDLVATRSGLDPSAHRRLAQ